MYYFNLTNSSQFLNQFLSENGGKSNAFTSAEHTNFYFDVAPEHLVPALDRSVCQSLLVTNSFF